MSECHMLCMAILGGQERGSVDGRSGGMNISYYILCLVLLGCLKEELPCSSGWLQTHDPAAHSLSAKLPACAPCPSSACVLKSVGHHGLDCHVFSCTAVTY